MKLVFKTITGLMLVMNLFSCVDHSQTIEQFRNLENKVDQKVLEKFPISIDSIKLADIVTVVSPSKLIRNYSGIFITYQMENETDYLNKLKEYSHYTSYENYLYNKSLLIIPDSLFNKENEKLSKDFLPVPSLSDNLNLLGDIINKENSQFIVFETQQGEFLKKPFSLVKENYMPKGYSIGLISDKSSFILTYWLIIW